jgi:glycosyltransferase involved in cell wall biosynthesis
MIEIAVDAREMGGRPTGVGRYLASLLNAWRSMPAAANCRFSLYVPERHDPKLSGLAFEPTDGSPQQRAVRVRGSGTWWEQVSLPLALARTRSDVLFAPAYSAPLATRLPIVLVIHDLSFIAHPEWFRPRERIRRSAIVRLASRRAAAVITISEFSKGEIVRHLRLPPETITVVPCGISAVSPVERRDDAVEPMLLYAGSIFNRRRLPDLIRGFSLLVRDNPAARLEIVGDNRTYPHQDLDAIAREEQVAERVAVRSYVSDDVLLDLYARARGFVFLSDYEGFGLPPLEAMAAGVPVVLLDTPVAREVCGEAALYVRAGDIGGLARTLEQLLFDADIRRRLAERAKRLLVRYSWDKAAAATLGVLLNVADRARSKRSHPR